MPKVDDSEPKVFTLRNHDKFVTTVTFHVVDPSIEPWSMLTPYVT